MGATPDPCQEKEPKAMIEHHHEPGEDYCTSLCVNVHHCSDLDDGFVWEVFLPNEDDEQLAMYRAAKHGRYPLDIGTLRAHVDEVVEIFDECPDYTPADHICRLRLKWDARQDWCWHRSEEVDGGGTERYIRLPSAARPGMFAARLAVRS